MSKYDFSFFYVGVEGQIAENTTSTLPTHMLPSPVSLPHHLVCLHHINELFKWSKTEKKASEALTQPSHIWSPWVLLLIQAKFTETKLQ